MFKIVNFRNNGGFTIIELLVSASIIAAISGIFFANYHSADRRAKLNMAVRQIAGDIRLTQSYAMGMKNFGAEPPAGGWGLYFSAAGNSYAVFADDGDKSYESATEKYQEIKLPQGFKLGKISDCALGDWGQGEMIFIPPNPDISLLAEGSEKDLLCVQLLDQYNNPSTIKINKLGLVEILTPGP